MFGFFRKKYSIGDARLLEGATDVHSHILPGVDDGIRTEEESLEAITFLESQGLKHLWLTPHIMEDVPNEPDGLRLRFEALKVAYGGGVELHLSAENMLDGLFSDRLDSGNLLPHRDDSLLVETSIMAPPIDLWDIFRRILSTGRRPLFAHPERYLYMKPSDYERARGLGVMFQLNLPSLTGSYGEEVQARAQWLLSKDWYVSAGSDCHRLRSLHHICSARVLSSKQAERLQRILR